MRTTSKPFFHRYQTKLTISDICSKDRLVIFAGAGVTIDQSELSWRAMIDSLLKPHLTDELVRRGFLEMEKNNPLAAATVAYQLYHDGSSGGGVQALDAREKIAADLRATLYRPGLWARGRLASAIADFATVWSISSGRKANQSRRITLVTTNYDDYLVDKLKESTSQMKANLHAGASSPELRVMYPTMQDPLRVSNVKPSSWISEGWSPKKRDLALIYLHGRIPRSLRSGKSSARLPVVSEKDYQLTRKWTVKSLVTLFKDNNVILVGTSLTDPPQIQALYRTKEIAEKRRLKRWAIFLTPTAAELPKGFSVDESVRLTTKRMKALGVTPIFVDYRVQIPQFFRELAICAEQKDPDVYSQHRYKNEYGQRLVRWWNRWDSACKSASFDYEQVLGNILLHELLEKLRVALDAPESEILKVEVWLRWKPHKHRKLRLWCSSVASWNEVAAMRDADIITDGDMLCVKAFRSGRPEAGDVPGSRWKNYVATPLWLQDKDGSGEFMAGVVTMASMADPAVSSLEPANNSASIMKALDLVTNAGRLIAEGNPRRIKSYIRQQLWGEP